MHWNRERNRQSLEEMIAIGRKCPSGYLTQYLKETTISIIYATRNATQKEKSPDFQDFLNRGNRIWTCDLTAPSRARYQATPYPAITIYYTRIAYKKQTIFQIPVCSCMCTTFLVNGAKSQWQGLAWGFPNSHLHREGLPYQVRYCHFHWQPVDFLVWLRRL